MLLRTIGAKITTCGKCELWSPHKHIMSSATGLCEKYQTLVSRHYGVCVWRDAVEFPELHQNIEAAYTRFKQRHHRPEITGRTHAVPTQRDVQIDLDLGETPRG